MLEWLGLDWDEGPIYQSACTAAYNAALRTLATSGAIYPCRCTRTQIQQATLSAPHAGEHELRYPGTCRPTSIVSAAEALLAARQENPPPAWRLRVEPGEQSFCDELRGPQTIDVAGEVGDFLVATKQGVPSYQLAVVVDDAAQQINCVVRGDDLLASTGRQMLIRAALHLESPMHYWHLPLIVGEDGRRLAKRHGDTRVAYYREQSVRSQRVLGLLAEWSGVGLRREVTLPELQAQFQLAALPRHAIVFHAEDDAWLRR